MACMVGFYFHGASPYCERNVTQYLFFRSANRVTIPWVKRLFLWQVVNRGRAGALVPGDNSAG